MMHIVLFGMHIIIAYIYLTFPKRLSLHDSCMQKANITFISLNIKTSLRSSSTAVGSIYFLSLSTAVVSILLLLPLRIINYRDVGKRKHNKRSNYELDLRSIKRHMPAKYTRRWLYLPSLSLSLFLSFFLLFVNEWIYFSIKCMFFLDRGKIL